MRIFFRSNSIFNVFSPIPAKFYSPAPSDERRDFTARSLSVPVSASRDYEGQNRWSDPWRCARCARRTAFRRNSRDAARCQEPGLIDLRQPSTKGRQIGVSWQKRRAGNCVHSDAHASVRQPLRVVTGAKLTSGQLLLYARCRQKLGEPSR